MANKDKKIWLNIGKLLLINIILTGFGIAGIASGLILALVKDEPVRSAEEIKTKILQNALTSYVYDRNDQLIDTFRTDEERVAVTYDEIPKVLENAFLAVEDTEFYRHHGVNFRALTRAVLQQVLPFGKDTGGSTITQQLAKQTFYSFDQTYQRKAREIFLALRIERILTKEEILTGYLNKIPFGKNANGENIFGIKAAAKGIFGISNLQDLNIAQAAFLAGLPQRPFAYTPFNNSGFDQENFERGINRQHEVLSRMLTVGFISQAEYEEAKAFDLKASLAKPSVKAYQKYPFLIMEVEKRAAEALLEAQGIKKEDVKLEEYASLLDQAKQELLHGGYRVYITIDREIQDKMDQIAYNPKNFGKNATYTFEGKKITNALEEVGATLIHNKTGEILGMIGGRDFSVSQINHATITRQPGSAMKPLAAYAPAIELKKLQPATIIDDVPIILDKNHIPENWDNKYHGLITAREALKWSYNIPAIKVYNNLVTIPKALDYLRQMGITTIAEQDRYAQTGVIGGLTNGATVEEMTNAYATFANQGRFVDAFLIRKIENANGEIIYEHQSPPQIVFSETTSFLITDMLRTVVNEGTGASVRNYINYNIDIAGKTGTTDSYKDVWFMGYTPEITLGVWVGYDLPYQLPKSSTGRAKEIWGKIMKEIYTIQPDLSPAKAKFNQPAGLVKVEVCAKTGEPPTELCKEANGKLISDWFSQDLVPKGGDEKFIKGNIVIVNGKRYQAKPETPVEFVTSGIFIKREPYVIPDDPKKPANYYYPLDYDLEYPNEVDPRTSTGTPATPNNVKLENGKISWEKNLAENIVGYRIYQVSNEIAGVIVQSIKQDQEPVWATNGLNGQFYVVSVDVDGVESKPSTIVGEPVANDNSPNNQDNLLIPTQPKNLTFTKEELKITLNWELNVANEQVTSYRIYTSSTKEGPYQLLDVVTEPPYTILNTPLINSWYRITAVNQYGESLPSNEIEIK